ncbi:hypothetical protein ABID47_001474 [Paenibacillus favisporus]|uniref:GNAT family N-acetyltransferase n=1 Tax=Paenibacillus favisporus TaxID=221028 RepID=A0ABV2EZE7_9BACL
MGIRLATKNELQWINKQYQKIGFMPSNLENEKIAIVTHQDEFAGVGRIVYLNAEEAEIGGIYILDEFRGLSLANESTKHNIKEFLLTSFVFEMTDTYDSLRLSRFAT